MTFKLELTNIPFQPRTNQVIYVESEYNDEINQYIQQHFKELKKRFAPDYEFVYIPYLYKEIDLNRIVQYYAPYNKVINVEWDQLNMHSDYLLNFMKFPENRSKVLPSLVMYSWSEGDILIFKGVQIEDVAQIDTFIIEQMEELTKWDVVLYKEACAKETKLLTADDTFNKDVEWLIRQTKENLSKLRKMGIGERVLQQLFYEDEKLSRLRITKDCRIFLPDYNMMEINMVPLPKAVFLLFLNHPDGIRFSYLPDYFEELKGYYLKTKRTDTLTNAMMESLRKVTNPLDNSINEKCARIKEAFIKKFDDHLARNYYISGEWGEAKNIPLPKELVEWEK